MEMPVFPSIEIAQIIELSVCTFSATNDCYREIYYWKLLEIKTHNKLLYVSKDCLPVNVTLKLMCSLHIMKSDEQ